MDPSKARRFPSLACLAPRTAIVRGLLALAAIAVIASLAALALDLHWNSSPSLPRGLYRRLDLSIETPIERGSLVLACPPIAIAPLARERGYLAHGDCPGSVAPLGKLVAATASDRVEVESRGVRVLDLLLPRSRPRLRDRAGRPLPDLRSRRFDLNASEAWLYSPFHPRSFDSRVFGPVPRDAIRGVLVPLLIADRSRLEAIQVKLRLIDQPSLAEVHGR